MIQKILIVILSVYSTTLLAATSLSGISQSDVSYSLTEIKLGRQFIRSARAQLPFVNDPEIVGYIKNLGNRLLEPAGLSINKFQFSVIDDDNLNAFAVPGGWISVHTGLVTATDSESELASVLSHEIAHITQRHLPRTFERAEQRTLPAVAAMMAAILVGGQVGSAALVGANAAVVADQLKYSREFEKEADAIGLELLSKGDFDVHAMPSFFLKLQESSALSSSNVPEYLRTHPLSVSRIADSEARVSVFPIVQFPENIEFLHIKARILALSSQSPDKQIDIFRQKALEGTKNERLASRYGEAISAMQASQYERARTLINQLLAENPASIRYKLAQAQIEISAGQLSAASKILANMHEQMPDDIVVMHYYAQVLSANKHYDQARKILRRLQRKDPDNAEVHSRMSRVHGELGRLSEAFISRAEYFILRYRLPAAEKELDKALEHVGDNYYLRSSIEARKSDVLELMRRFDEQPISES